MFKRKLLDINNGEHQGEGSNGHIHLNKVT